MRKAVFVTLMLLVYSGCPSPVQYYKAYEQKKETPSEKKEDTIGASLFHWNTSLYFSTVTVLKDLKRDIAEGKDVNAKDDYGDTAWEDIQHNEALKNTDVYWELNDLRYSSLPEE